MKIKQSHDDALGRLFFARKWALISAIVFSFASLIAHQNFMAAFILVIAAGCFVVLTCTTWFYIYRITQSLYGFGYALGHVAISVLLTPVFFTGLILIPLLVRGDVKRLT